MAFLLDTNICSYVIKQKPASVYNRLSRTTPAEVFVSVITVYELFTGCEKSSKRERLLQEVRKFLWPFSLISLTEQHAFKAASLRARLDRAGTPIGPYDLLLAAQALVEGLVLVTNNTREFRRVDQLRLENWTI